MVAPVVFVRVNRAQFKRMFVDRKGVAEIIMKRNQQGLVRFGAFVMTRARQSIRTPPYAKRLLQGKTVTKRTRRYSKAGKPPYNQTGLLKEGIFFGYDSSRETVYIGPEYLGGRGGITRSTQTIPETLEYGGTRNVSRPQITTILNNGHKLVKPAWSKVARYEARPYMRPAFNQTIKKHMNTVWLKPFLK